MALPEGGAATGTCAGVGGAWRVVREFCFGGATRDFRRAPRLIADEAAEAIFRSWKVF